MVSEMDTARLNLDPVDDVAFPGAARPNVPPIDYLFGAPDDEPVVASDPAQTEIRYERGSMIYAQDGPVGTLKHVVIDEDQAEVKALVVRLAAKNESVLMPPELIEKSVGTALFLSATKAQFALGASRSPRFESRMFARADARTLARIIPLAFRGNKQRSVVSLNTDWLVTSEALDPSRLPSLPARRSRWNFFGRGNAG
jgi:hypothetical protein